MLGTATSPDTRGFAVRTHNHEVDDSTLVFSTIVETPCRECDGRGETIIAELVPVTEGWEEDEFVLVCETCGGWGHTVALELAGETL